MRRRKTVAIASRVPASRRLATVAMVKSILHRNAETKLVGRFNSTDYNQYINTAADARPLLPSLPQGVTDNTRVGNKIVPRGLLVSMTLSLNQDSLENPVPPSFTILPRVLVLTQKDTGDMAFIESGGGFDISHLMDYGTGEHAFSGGLDDYMAPVNKDAFSVHKDIKTKLTYGNVEANPSICRTYKFWIKCPKTLEYNDNQNYPRNFAPFFCAAYAKPDNTVDIAAITALKITYTSTLYFEDA